MSGDMMNAVRREAERVMQQRNTVRLGVVTNYDPDTFSAKVRVQPEDVETGWLPISSPWVGNGWGMFAAPKAGDVVEVHFQEGGRQAGMIGLRQFGDALRPLPVPPGEFWMQHESGSFFKFKNNGEVQVHAAANMTATVAGHASVTVGGTATLTAAQVDVTANVSINGDLTVNGDLLATGDIRDLNGGGGTVGNIRDTFNIHTHPAPGGTTDVPNEQI